MNSSLESGLDYRRALVWLLGAAWLLALVVALGPGRVLQTICGLPLVLFLPGALVGYALLPPGQEVSGSLRLVLSFALSVVAALLVGLFLALCFDQVSRAPAAVGLALIATVATLVARGGAATGERLAVARVPVPPAMVAIVTGILLVACVAIGVAALNVSNLPGHFTALTVSPSAAGARVEVRSQEGQETSYRYVVRGQGERSLRSGTIELDGGETRTLDLPVPRDTHAISVSLYTDGSEPYREVTLRGLN